MCFIVFIGVQMSSVITSKITSSCLVLKKSLGANLVDVLKSYLVKSLFF